MLAFPIDRRGAPSCRQRHGHGGLQRGWRKRGIGDQRVCLPAPPAQAAQLIYKNGTVLTLDENNSVAQAARDFRWQDPRRRRIDFAIEKHIGSSTRVIDLGGSGTLIRHHDAHSHLVFAGTQPAVRSRSQQPADRAGTGPLAAAVGPRGTRAKLGPDAWITGFGYDDTLLAERRHPTRADLDQVSATQPILITHVSGHLAVANSVALALAGIDAATADPSGGVIRKDASGEPDGVLEETAVQMVGGLEPPLTAAQVQAATKAISALYASRGVTTASDGAERCRRHQGPRSGGAGR